MRRFHWSIVLSLLFLLAGSPSCAFNYVRLTDLILFYSAHGSYPILQHYLGSMPEYSKFRHRHACLFIPGGGIYYLSLCVTCHGCEIYHFILMSHTVMRP